ncbi:MAG: Fur family transcriptional regulator [Giesbergeria sp.]
MRATRASRALAALYQVKPQAALSVPEVAMALDAAGVVVNRVTVYRLLDRFAAAGLLQRQIDGARVTRFVLVPPDQGGVAPRFECGGCHRQFRLAQASARMQAALAPLLRTLAQAGHENLAVDIAVHGLCAGCAHPEGTA